MLVGSDRRDVEKCRVARSQFPVEKLLVPAQLLGVFSRDPPHGCRRQIVEEVDVAHGKFADDRTARALQKDHIPRIDHAEWGALYLRKTTLNRFTPLQNQG